MIGIYKFTSKTTGLSYIGQSIHILTRYDQHLAEAQKGAKKNTKWHKALREQGIDNFDFSILEECHPAELNMKEVYWIAHYDSYHNGYNSTPGGQEKYYDPTPIYTAWDEGLSVSEISQKLNIGVSCVRYNLKDYQNYSVQESNRRGGILAKKTVQENNTSLSGNTNIYQYDLLGNFIKQWDSCKEIERQLKFDSALIGKCVQEKRKSAYDYQWKSFYAEHIDAYTSNQGKATSIVQYDKQWNKIAEYPSIAAASRATGCDPSLLRRACKSPETKSAGGFKWKKAE